MNHHHHPMLRRLLVVTAAATLVAGLSLPSTAAASTAAVSSVSTSAASASADDAAASVSASSKADRIIAFAQSLRGKVKYVYGANQPSRLVFDCSSFTKYVFASEGVSLKWGSTAQSKQGVKVGKDSLRKGDLMFFRSSSGSSSKISHVGIYIGDGKFIHNTIGSNVNGVVISSFNSSYQKRFVSAARVL
ncbi:C40 family peptidase [Paenibacillus pasadenensis]|uniref:C40 family peptidase n=1 Tax=Paenibacillus TaxID=44249 RepID=UPI0004175958|nr:MULTISPECIES: C40 family peptidase [Paenibacillus]QGG57063.1 NlpC/P60 family protein [Paenibacillus sp. B01]